MTFRNEEYHNNGAGVTGLVTWKNWEIVLCAVE